MPTASQRVRVEGIISIALFMLMAAVVTPEPTPRGVGLRGVSRRPPVRVELPRAGHPRAAESVAQLDTR